MIFAGTGSVNRPRHAMTELWLAVLLIASQLSLIGLALGGVQPNPIPAFQLAEMGSFWLLKIVMTEIQSGLMDAQVCVKRSSGGIV